MTNTHTKQPHVVRHPIVVIMGHVDHGKTTLLDCIRKTNIVAREAGGITQHLGAYEINWNGKQITFLDTPGHATFSLMRERGAHVADLAILVVAADDGVKPQTKEALEAIKKAGIPFIVAINKIDKTSADIERVKGTLAEAEVLVEGWGGTVPCVPISAKSGEHVDELLNTVLLAAELEELTAELDVPAEGVILEAHLDSRRGPTATILVTNGTLTRGSFILCGETFAPVRIFESVNGEAIEKAGPSTPVRVAGFNEVPRVGTLMKTFESKAELEKDFKVIEALKRKKEVAKAGEVGILVKADVIGSLEALEAEFKKIIPEGLEVTIFDGGVGEIGEADVKLISAAKRAIIIGFHTKVKSNILELAERLKVEVKLFNIIYEAIDWTKERFDELRPRKIMRVPTGKMIVLKVFKSNSHGRVVGGRVREGRVPKDAQFEVLRGDEVVARGHIKGLQKNKAEAEELVEGNEGGLLVEVSRAIEERDVLQFFYEREA